MTIRIPSPTVTPDDNINRFAELLHGLYQRTATIPREIATEIQDNAVVQVFGLGQISRGYTRTSFDLSSPFQEFWYEENGQVIKVQLQSDFAMYGDEIINAWRRTLHSELPTQVFNSAVTELLLKLALLALRKEHKRLQSLRTTLLA